MLVAASDESIWKDLTGTLAAAELVACANAGASASQGEHDRAVVHWC